MAPWHLHLSVTNDNFTKQSETHVSKVSGLARVYRGEDMQDGVNVPALGGRIPDRDRDTHS